MANFQQSYFGYGTGVQYDGSGSQNKWGSGTNSGTGNQTQSSQSHNQQQMYQTAAQNYAASSGFYGNQAYTGQQQTYSYTGSVDSNMSMSGSRNSSNSGTGTTSTSMGNKSYSSFGNSSGTGSANANAVTGSGTSTNSYSAGYGSSGTGGSFGNNAADNKTASSAQNQMHGGGYGNTGQNSGMSNFNSNMTSNMSMPVTSQTQNFGNPGTGDTLNQLSQISQLFGNGTNFGSFTPGDGSGGNFGTGYNQAFNPGMMTLLQQTLMQQAAGADATGTGSFWSMGDGDGGYYAPPVDGNYQSGMASIGNKQGKKWKKWSGKDNSNRQEFYGNRFAHMLTGAPGILGQSYSQPGSSRGKRLMDGVRINIKGEKVMDVEIPLTLYSRWGQLRKFFSKQDTEVAKHLIEFHDEMCEECLEREQRKNKGYSQKTEKVVKEEEKEEKELTEEDLMLQQVMGFGNFSTTREAMTEGDAASGAAASAVNVKSGTSSSWEVQAGFIGPTQPNSVAQGSQDESKSDQEPALSEEEKRIMEKLGWSVFNKKKNEKEEDDDDDNEEKMDDGGKDGSAAKVH